MFGNTTAWFGGPQMLGCNTSVFICLFILGVTLSETNRTVTWDPEIKDEYPCNFKLIIKQILLGHEAAANVYNVVQVSAISR